MDYRISHVIQLMKAEPQRLEGMRELAQAVNLSESRLTRLFKQATGYTPRQYQKLLKLSLACSLLESTFLSVKQVAAAVGWKDMTHFQRDFRRIYRVTPAQYRRNRWSSSHSLDPQISHSLEAERAT